MSDTINTIVDKKAFEQLTSLAFGIKDARLELVKLLEVGKQSPINVKSYADLGKRVQQNTKSYKDLNLQQKENERLTKALAQAQAKFVSAQSTTNKKLQETRFETNQVNKKYREQAVLSSKLATEYQKQSVILNQLRRKYKDVALTQGESSRAARKLQKEVTELDAKLKRVDGNVGQFQRSVGNYGKAFKGLGGVIRSTAAAFGLMGGAFMAVQIFKNGVNRVREFDKEMQNMAGIVRGSREELADLEKEIIDVAASSVKTSNEVAKLATSLLTLGKTKEEVKLLLKPVNDLGIGLNTTSEEAGEFLVQTLNSFGEGAESAGKFADIIATIRTSTSLDFQKMRDSFQYLSPISRALGKDVAYTGAVIGILADNGLKAEQAGRLLGTAQQRLAKQGRTLLDALNEINDAQARGETQLQVLARASKLFGAQAGKVGVILANNTNIIEKNAEAIRNNSGALKDLTESQLESLDAKIKILDSTWEQFILNIENGEGSISGFFKGAIEGATKFLKFLDKINGSASERREGSAYSSTLDEIKAEAERTGKSVQEVAAQSVDAYDDEVFKISEKIRLMKEENAEIEKRKGKEGGILGSDENKKWKANAAAIEEASARLDIYKGMLEAAVTLEGSAAEEKKENDKEIAEGEEEVNGLRKQGLLILEGTAAAYKKYISEQENERDRLAQTNAERAVYNKRIDEAKEKLKELEEGLKTISELEMDDLSIDLDLADASGLQNTLDSKIPAAMQNLSNILGQDMESLMTEFATFYEWDYENFLKWSQKKIDQSAFESEQKREALATYMQMASDVIFEIGNIFNNVSQAKISKIDEEIAKQDEQYQNWLSNENLSERQRKIYEEQQEKDRKKLEEKKNKEKTKQAKINKGFAIFDIAINSAAAIVRGLKDLGPIGAILYGALAAAQMTAVLTTPIPKYKHGRKGGKAETAIVGDGGRKEVVTDKQGNFKYVTPDKPTLTHLEAGDIVHKSEGDYETVMRASVMASLNQNLPHAEAQKAFDDELMIQTIKEGFRNVVIQTTNNNENSELLRELKFQRRRDAI